MIHHVFLHIIVFVFKLKKYTYINIIVKICSLVYLILFRKNNSSRIDIHGNLLPCCKRPIYQDIVLKTEESSTYQELNLADTASQNTAT